LIANTAAEPSYSRRAAAVRRTITEMGLDALVVTHPANLRYLTGFGGSLGILLLTRSPAALIVDGRYITSTRDRLASASELGWLQVELAARSLEEAVASAIRREQLGAVGVEASVMTLSRFNRLNGLLRSADGLGPAVRLVPTEQMVEKARMIKDPEELTTLRRAGATLSKVAAEVLAIIEPGRKEVSLAAEIDALLRGAGFSRPAFDTIVASGPNSALPHAHPGSRQLTAGDSVVLDFGGVYDGYCVDLTRTVQLPPATDAFMLTFEAVKAAQAAAIAAVRPGVQASAVDAAARAVLAARGLGDAFVHGTGHGLGLEVHEEPRITRAGTAATDEVLQPGMVFTVEPGAYLPGALGVRIEDDVVVTEDGCELLTQVPIHPVSDSGRTRSGAGGRSLAGE
jgi:Xaa-Pro aminopeptidase